MKYGDDVLDLVTRIYPPFPSPDFKVDVNFSNYQWLFTGQDWAFIYKDIAQQKEVAIAEVDIKLTIISLRILKTWDPI